MAEKITLAQLDIDIAALTKKQAEYLKQITTIKGEQKALRKSTEGLTTASQEELKTYTQKDAELKKLNTSYTQQKNILAEVKTGVNDLSSALNKEINTVRDAQKNNSKLIKIRNQVNVKTKEGQRAITQINAKLTRNNALINKNSSALEKQRMNIGNYGTALRGMGNILRSAGLIGGVAGLVLAFKGLFKIISGFQSGVSNLAAVLNKPVSQIKTLSDNAIKLGATTAKTATEVLGLQEAYARLGFKQQAIIDLTKPTINASVALNSNLADTANLAGAVVNSFDNLTSADAPLILDQITAATQNSALTFEKLQTGIPNVAAAASAAGVPFSKLLALLGKLADSGIDASKSSTSLRNIFIESAKEGLSYEQILEKIKGSQDKLTSATDEFGKRAAVSAIALSKNIDSTKELDLVIQGAAGTAQRAADTQLDNLQGAITLLSSGFDGFVLSIENGTGGTAKFVRGIIDATTAMFNFLTPTNKVSDSLIEQRNEVNLLVFQLGDLNTTESDRIKIIDRLNKIAPDLVKTLDDQGIATAKTRKELDKLNNSFIANIALQIKAEELTKVATVEAERRIIVFEKEAKVAEQLATINRKGTAQQRGLISLGQSLGKTNFEIADSLIEIADKSNAFLSKSNAGNVILDASVKKLNEYALELHTSTVSLEQAEGATNLLREETEKLKQSFIDAGFLSDEIIPDKKKVKEATVLLNNLVEVDLELLQKKLLAQIEAEKKAGKFVLENEKRIAEKIATGRDILFRESLNAAEEEGVSKLAIQLLTINEQERLANEQAKQTISDTKVLEREKALIEKEFRDMREEAILLSEAEIQIAKLEQIQTFASQINSVLVGFSNNSLERSNIEAREEINNVNKTFEAKFKAAGEDQALIIKLEKDKEAELRKIDDRKRDREKKNAIFQKALAVTQSIIDTAIAVGKALLSFPFPPLSTPQAIAAGIFGAAQTAVIASAPIPKFATGTKRVLGDGTETSDSVPALLSKNERIVDARNNRKIGFDLSNDQLATAAKMYRSFSFNGGGVSNQSVVDAINKNTKVLKGKAIPHTSVHVSDGFEVVNKSKYLT